MNSSRDAQLALSVSLDDNATFENFLIAPRNAQALHCLADPAQAQQLVAIWGGSGSGLTHLLQAACQQRAQEHRNALYLPLTDRAELHPDILQGVDSLSLVCIDDVQSIAGDTEWEAALFTAFNAIRETRTQLVIAAHCAPAALPIALPDLASRLQSCLVFQIGELDDREKVLALQLRAKNRGMAMSDGVAEYILHRAERNLVTLMTILERLDEVSLTQQRRLTIPLVKTALGW